MPDLLEFQEVIESYPVVLAILGIAVALAAALITRAVDQSALDSAHERLAAYEEEVGRLNEARADLLARLEERGDELRRAKAELARLERAARPETVRPRATPPEDVDRTEASIVPGHGSHDPLRPR